MPNVVEEACPEDDVPNPVSDVPAIPGRPNGDCEGACPNGVAEVPKGEELIGSAPKGVVLVVKTEDVNGEGFAGAEPNAGGFWLEVDTPKGDWWEDTEPKALENGEGLDEAGPKGDGF